MYLKNKVRAWPYIYLSDDLSLTKSRRFCIDLSLRHRPVTVAILQCYTVGVNVILQSNCKV